MLFVIDHLTLYRYSSPVQLGDHGLRFHPLDRPGQRALAFELQIDPSPVSCPQTQDTWGNPLHRVQFAGETDHLEIRVRLEVETLAAGAVPEPVDFPLVPVDAGTGDALAAYLEPLEQPSLLDDFIMPLASAAAGRGMIFLHALNEAIHGFYHHGVRLDGPPVRPIDTLAARAGVCRDLTVLFMAACRRVGLPARFVSGYQQGEGTRAVRYLHAWPEVWIPDSGWYGLDPTHASVVGTKHVAVAAGPTAASVTPVEGGYSFRGAALRSTLETEIRIDTRQ